ncbi:phosphotransferase [Streptomyces purpurogeneiscleroticus]|uniref:phosphotransferase n=1 Tax=Streptomyces purpurogeneiscleroticus TaxID=68259 RepID=UPI001CBBC692|nr:phosphotransferase [Streptomyces purpurogeneiscleroticus]MBZ4016526.1 aminoglycoside phosphotransferase [Streptomyces purpurogeneiscleroticus]
MLRSSAVRTATAPDGHILGSLLRRYEGAGEPLTCEPVAEGLLNHGYRLVTTRGRFFLKHHLDADRADCSALVRQHRATRLLGAMGLPVAPPVRAADGRTVAVIDGRCYALHPWVEGRHLDGAALTPAQCHRLGALLGRVHVSLAQVMPDEPPQPGQESADPAATFVGIDELLALARDARPHDSFDALAEHRLLERRALLAAHAHHRPPRAAPAGWVHGDFHPLNLLYRGAEPAAIVDWDRLAVKPRAEEAVRAAAIFFVRPSGSLDLAKVAAYARAYRGASGVGPEELAAAVHRVWWERLNDFWMLDWRYRLGDRRADSLFPASAALAVWWTDEYAAVRGAFTG